MKIFYAVHRGHITWVDCMEDADRLTKSEAALIAKAGADRRVVPHPECPNSYLVEREQEDLMMLRRQAD
jgi:hypothetical protein